MNNNIDGYTKSACFLFFLGIKKSTKILNHLDLEEKKKIIFKMSDLSIFSKKNINIAINSYKKYYKKIFFEKNDYVKNYFNSIISRSFNDKERNKLFNIIKIKKEFLKNVKKANLKSSKNCYLILNKEHPQIIAIFLKYLNKKKSIKILSFFNKNYRYEIIRRMFKIKHMNKFSKENFFKIINHIFKEKKNIKYSNFEYVIKIFKSLSKKEKVYMLKNFFEKEDDIKKKIICEIFSFEDIFKMNNKNVYILLKYVNKEILYISIINLFEKFRNKFLKNMSKIQLNYFFKMIKENNLKFSKKDILISKQNILKILRFLLKKNILILKDLEKIYV
ncbi:FliG C-terminal domain-containing protein [Buchnera aphidicola]|uniref:FliG C-terminal domain-containing protein n=1 Tax=Buchnera aphidicola TaxID=9 RepID=UPI0031B876A5